MQNIKLNDPSIKTLARRLANANVMVSEATREIKIVKSLIAEKLGAKGVDLETLAIGEMIKLNDNFLISIGKQNKFDLDGFSVAHPVLYQEFKKDFPTKKFQPLV